MAPRLKNLELHGYKTFASRYKFEFPADITAIVGPNGSGKSNVADAIRWVLGEQSYSTLRGKRTEDMIFSGSELRPRSGMATASITFNNEDGWLPIDYSEVTISRRAYRDGQNEYLLNGKKVRLKEISELLAQSGLAQRTYTIIGQGLVDAALSISPDERRKFFEEAAGIGLYRKRREEALNRLETTRRNMERVNDILTELAPRLKSLERQARRSQEYERIKADLKVLLREWYGFHWHKNQEDLSHAKDVLTNQQKRLEAARSEKENADKEISQYRLDLQNVRAELNGWHKELSGIHENREIVSKELAVIDERYRMMLEQENRLKSELSQLEEEHKFQKGRVESQTGELTRKKEELKEARRNLQEAEENLNQRQVERGRINKQIRISREKLLAKEKQKVELNVRRDELGNRLKSQEESINVLEKSIIQKKHELQSLEDELQGQKSEKEKIETQHKNLLTSIGELEEKVKRTSERLNTLRNDINQKESQKIKTNTQYESLLQAEKSFSGLNQGAQYILSSNKDGVLKGKFSALSAQIEVAEEYEAAVAAVLGDYLDGIVLSPDADLANSLKLLEKGEKGKAIFLPQNAVKSGRLSDLKKKGIIGRASDHVKAADEISEVVNTLLGQVFLVEDRDIAISVIDEIPENMKLVTLKGEVFYGNGTVIAGKDGRSGLISRTRLKNELSKKLEKITKELDDLKKKFASIEQGLGKEKQELQKREVQAKEKRKELERARQFLSNKQNLFNQQKQKINFESQRIDEIQKEIIRNKEQVEKLKVSINSAEQEIQTLNKSIRSDNQKLSSILVEELHASVNHWKTNFALASQSVNSAGSLLNTYNSQLQNIQSQKVQGDRRLESVNYELTSNETRKGGLQGSEKEVNDKISALQEKIEPSELKLRNIEETYNQKQEDQKEIQQGLSIAERYESQAQHDLTRQKDSLDLLRKRIEDDFGLVSFEYQTDISGPTPLPLDGMVNDLPFVKEIDPEIEMSINRQRTQIRRMGSVNPEAHIEYEKVEERSIFLSTQLEDLVNADKDLREVISELDMIMREEFQKTFNAVANEFKGMFTRLFGGGTAQLVLLDAENPTEAGVDIEATLPGRRKQGLSMLSGGERSLTAAALIFSLLKVSPTPFCVLDEVDAALDEANVGRFGELLKELSEKTQFIVITHNRNTVQVSDVIYGVTMGRDSASQVISLKLEEVGNDMVQ